MGPSSLRIVLLVSALVAQAHVCAAYVSVPLTNADMTDFSSGVAQYWAGFVAGEVAPPGPFFYADSNNFRSAPCAQGISAIDVMQAPGVDFGAGLCRQVSATPGHIYFLVGFQDLYDATYMPAPARRYSHFFGIEPTGDMNVTQPFTMGNVRWMGPGQWLYNDMPGNSTQIGGMHRCMAAWPAQSGLMSVWSGVWVNGDAATSFDPTVFDTDAFTLFEFDNPARGLFCNPSFDAIDNLTPGYDVNDVHRITLPIYWAPVGGGIGQKESYYTEAAFKRTGAAGLRIYNHRGCFTRGMTQKVSVPAGNHGVTFSAYVKSNKNAGTIAKLGIDPTGGEDINSPNVVWSYYSRTDEAWEPVVVSSPCTPEAAVSVFVAAANQAGTTGNVHYADFDDSALAFSVDLTPPPADYVVSAESPTTLTGFLWATTSPQPSDPETGIATIEYAVGAAPGGEQVRAYTQIADPSLITVSGLSLTPGQTYYISVKATNGAGLSTTVASNPILCSPRPYTYAWSPAQHLSRTACNADNARLCAGSGGDVYAVWRESNDVTWSGSSSLITLRKRTGSSWGEPVKVNATANQWWPDVAWNGAAAGVPYLNPGAELQNALRWATLADGGSPTEQYIRTNVSAFPRVGYTPATGWLIGCTLNTTADPAKGRPVLMVEKPAWYYEMLPEGLYSLSDHRVRLWTEGTTTHILWGRVVSGQPGLYYCSRSSQATYSPPRFVAQGVGTGSIAVIGSEVNIAYATGGGVWHTRSTDGVTFEMPRYLGFGSNPSLYADQSGRLHVLFFSPTGAVNENNVSLASPIHMFRGPDGWSVPTAICAPSCTSGSWAEEPGRLIADSNGGLHFAWSNNPHDRGTQGGQFQGYYWIDYYTTTPVAFDGGEIVRAKLWGDDAPAQQLGYAPSKMVSIASGEVTATGTFRARVQSVWRSVPYFCIEQQDRVSAIKVIAGDAQDSPLPAISVSPGDLASVSGPIATTNGERTIGYLAPNGTAQGVSYAKSGTASDPIAPVFMSTRAVGGATLLSTLGVTGGSGANNVGLLVAIAGEVVLTSIDERGVKVLYVDDGSGAPCGPATGCRVYAPGSSVQQGDFVAVVGVSSIEPYGQDYIRVVMPRDADAIQVLTQQ